MSGAALWKSADGRWIVNLRVVASVHVNKTTGDLSVYTIGDHGGECVTVRAADSASFLTALDAAYAPTFMAAPDPIIDVDAVIERLDRLRGDMATVGGNALVEAVRELAIAIRGVGRG